MQNLQKQLDEQRRKVDVDHYDISTRELVHMASRGELVLAPQYQRKFRWRRYDESRLIESLFLGLPVPSIYVATNADGTWELVDGVQRVSTIIHFLGNEEEVGRLIGQDQNLRLDELETLTDFKNQTFSELPTQLQLLFSRRPIRVTALSDKSDPEVRFDMFERLNRGGIALTPQEVRACIFRGRFSDLLRRLSEDPSFQSLLKLQEAHKQDGTNEELVLKFFAYLYERRSFNGRVKQFLNKYMEEASKSFDQEKNSDLFIQVSNQMAGLLNGKPFLRKGVHVTPQNQFEACMVAMGELLIRGIPVQVADPNWPNDRALVAASTKGTNSSKSLNGRINRAIELFSGLKSEEVLAR